MLKIKIAGLTFKNPVLTASGTFGYGDELTDLLDVNKLGGIVLKGLTLKPKEGNPVPRIAETPSGILNSIGLQNIGVDRFLKEKVKFLKTLKTVRIANIAGASIEENLEIIRRLNTTSAVDAFELNVSCPNVKQGGLAFGTDRIILGKLVKHMKKTAKKPLIVKLSPNVTDITEIARTAEGEGADILSAINTVRGMSIDIEKKRPLLARGVGGLSGQAIRPIGVLAVWMISEAVKIPVIGMGGIASSDDALEYILAGASLVQVGTAGFMHTKKPLEIIQNLSSWCRTKKISGLKNLIGQAKKPFSSPSCV